MRKKYICAAVLCGLCSFECGNAMWADGSVNLSEQFTATQESNANNTFTKNVSQNPENLVPALKKLGQDLQEINNQNNSSTNNDNSQQNDQSASLQRTIAQVRVTATRESFKNLLKESAPVKLSENIWKCVNDPQFLEIYCKGDYYKLAKVLEKHLVPFTGRVLKTPDEICASAALQEAFDNAVTANLTAGANTGSDVTGFANVSGYAFIVNVLAYANLLHDSFTNDLAGDAGAAAAYGRRIRYGLSGAVQERLNQVTAGFELAQFRVPWLFAKYGNKACKYLTPISFDFVNMYMGLLCTQYVGDPATDEAHTLEAGYDSAVGDGGAAAGGLNLLMDNTDTCTLTQQVITQKSLEIVSSGPQSYFDETNPTVLGTALWEQRNGYWYLVRTNIDVYATGYVGNQPVGKGAAGHGDDYRNTIVNANPIYALVNGLGGYANLMDDVIKPARDRIKANESEYDFLADMMVYLRDGGGWPARTFNGAAAQPANANEVLLYLAHYLLNEANIPTEVKFIAHVFNGLAQNKTVADLFNPAEAASIPGYLTTHPETAHDGFVGYMVNSAKEAQCVSGATTLTIWLAIGRPTSGIGGIVWGWLNHLYMESLKYGADANSVELAAFDSKCFPFGSKLAVLADVCHYDQTGGGDLGNLKTYVAGHSAGGTPVPMGFLEFFHYWLRIQ